MRLRVTICIHLPRCLETLHCKVSLAKTVLSWYSDFAFVALVSPLVL